MSMRGKRGSSSASSTKSSGFVPPKRKHVKLPIEQKLSVIERMENGESVGDLAAEFGIGTRTVYDLRRHKAELLKVFSTQEAQKDAERSESKVSESTALPLVDKATYEWFMKCQETNENVSVSMIMAKAKFFHEQMKVLDYCDYNVEWLTSFKNRYNLGALELSGDSASSDISTADTYITKIPKVEATDHNASDMDYVECIGGTGGTMTTMGRLAQEVREMYLSKFKKMSPYTCNAMSPRVLLLRLNQKVIEKYTRQHKGKSDPDFSEEEEDWHSPSGDDWTNEDWNMTLLEPIVQISDESNSRRGSKRKYGGIESPKKSVASDTDRRKNPIDSIPIKQESPDPMVEIPQNVTDGILPSSSPCAPSLPMFQVPSVILPVYVTQPPPAQPSPSFPQRPTVSENSSPSFPRSNTGGLFKSSNRQTTRTRKSARQANKAASYNKDNIEANIKQELPEEVIVMPFQSDLHSDEPVETRDEEVCASPLPVGRDYNASEDNSVQTYPNGKPSNECDDPLVNPHHKSLKELTRLLLELNNKNLQCDEKIQKLKEEYDKKVAIIETEKKANEKEIDRVLFLIQNWKEGPREES